MLSINPHINKQILLQADLDDILNLCWTNKNFQQICNDHSFWIEKYQQMGASLVEYQSSVSGYIEDLKNCLAILPTIDLILQKLLLGRRDGEDHETLKLESVLTNTKPLRIPSIDIDIVQKMLDLAKKEELRNERVVEQNMNILDQVNFNNIWLKLFNWGLSASLLGNMKQRKFLLSLYIPRKHLQKTFDITSDARTYIYLLSYYGVVSKFEVEEYPQQVIPVFE